HGSEGIEGFCAKPLSVGELKIPRRDIIDDRVSGDMLQSRIARNLTRPPADNNAEFGFVIDLLAHRWNHDCFFRSDDGAAVHAEQERLFWYLAFDFFDVVPVIEADSDQLLRTR